jgi:hypothetical protein
MCHPERPHKGNGLCNNCWQRQWRTEHPGQTWQERNPEIAKDYGRSWYAANRERIAEKRRDARADGRYRARDRRIFLAYHYGLTPDQYRDMLVGQAGRCLICLRVPTKDLVIDHDHATGTVRGLLCQQCNKGIGLFADNAMALRSAARYVEVVA